MNSTSPKIASTKGFLFFSSIVIDLIILDQLTKYFARTSFGDSPIEVIPQWFYLTYSENVGIAWSIPIPQTLLLLGIPLLFIAGVHVSIKYFNYQKRLTQAAFSLIFAGAISNYADRIIFGHVIDFISVGSFPIFNLADAYITCAAFIIIVFYGKIERIN